MERDDRGPYGWTLYLELCASLFRFIPAILPAVLIIGLGGMFALFGLDGIGLLSDVEAEQWYDGLIQVVLVSAGVIAVLPVALSVLTLWGLRGGFGLTAKELDARPPSNREWQVIADAVQRVLAEAPAGTIGPERWLILDKVDLNAAVMGRALYIHRALIHSEYLDAVIAHELGHLNNGDGRLILALRRLVPPPFSFLTFAGNGCLPLPLLLMLCGGGFGLLLTTPWWNRYWREREYLADRFAYECGQANGLIELLELYQFFDVAVPFGFLWRSHPHNEERIDRLLGYLEDEEDTFDAPLRAGRAREIEEVPLERKRGFTDAEAVLEMVVLDEAHAGWTAQETFEIERAWMNANGRRILTNAYVGYDTMGRGVVLMLLTGDPSDWLSGRKFNYMRQSEHTKYLHSTTSAIMQEVDPVMRAEWEQRVADYDPERTMIGLIVSFDHRTGREGVSYYQLSPAGGGALADRVMELIPQE